MLDSADDCPAQRVVAPSGAIKNKLEEGINTPSLNNSHKVNNLI